MHFINTVRSNDGSSKDQNFEIVMNINIFRLRNILIKVFLIPIGDIGIGTASCLLLPFNITF